MTHLDFLATLVDKLDDMESELRLHNLRHSLGVCQAECHIGESRVKHTTSRIIEFTTATSRTRVLRVETGKGLECRLPLIDTVGIVTQLLFHTVDFLLFYPGLLGDNLHLHLSRYKRQTVLRHVLEIATYLSG